MATYKWDDKDPNDVLDYDINWSSILTPDSDTITSVTHTISTISGDASPLAIDTTKPSSGEPFTTTGTTVWLKDGTAGETYYVTSEIVTAGARVYNRKVRLRVKDL